MDYGCRTRGGNSSTNIFKKKVVNHERYIVMVTKSS